MVPSVLCFRTGWLLEDVLDVREMQLGEVEDELTNPKAWWRGQGEHERDDRFS